MIKKVLTIAGSDSSGGAGIQADIKTITVHKMYAMSVITSLTAQNTTGVYDIMDASPEFVERQIDCVFDDIFPDAVKIGMVSNAKIISVIADKLNQYKPKSIVIDPVMVSTSGSKLLSDGASSTLVKELLPLGTVITPNIPEAEILSGMRIENRDDMLKSAQKIAGMINTAVLVKAGHFENDATDLLFADGEAHWYPGERINNPNAHGTGCTLSSAIACGLAEGRTLEQSVKSAKDYLTGALKAGLNLGKGAGPLEHTYILR